MNELKVEKFLLPGHFHASSANDAVFIFEFVTFVIQEKFLLVRECLFYDVGHPVGKWDVGLDDANVSVDGGHVL